MYIGYIYPMNYPVPERSEGTEVSKLAIRSDEITVLA